MTTRTMRTVVNFYYFKKYIYIFAFRKLAKGMTSTRIYQMSDQQTPISPRFLVSGSIFNRVHVKK